MSGIVTELRLQLASRHTGYTDSSTVSSAQHEAAFCCGRLGACLTIRVSEPGLRMTEFEQGARAGDMELTLISEIYPSALL